MLVALYCATGGPNWRNNANWLSDEPLWEWHGVTTDAEGRVIRLSLEDNQLRGTIPPRLGNLSNLTILSLRDNQLSGPIPIELANLAKLEWLLLNGNQLSGTIPRELGNLANLTILWLHSNQLSGMIPRELGNLAKLQQLVLWTNELSGCVPPALHHVSDYCGYPLVHAADRAALVALYHATDGPNWSDNTSWLSDKPLSKWYGVATEEGEGRVVRLDLNNNQLSGTIPPELGSLSRLTELKLQNNRLRGEIPPELGALSNLKLLWLHSNQLSGTIPRELGKLSRLTWLELRTNKLTGCVPEALHHVSRYCVSPPMHAADRAALAELYRAADGPKWSDSTNWLSDSPEWHGVRTDHEGRVTGVQLQENQLSGELPPELGDLTRLEVLDFHGNADLNGRLPEGLAGSGGLRYLRFDRTGLCAPADDRFQRWLLNRWTGEGSICPPEPSTHPPSGGDGVIVRDLFGRVVNDAGIVLVDWEGYIANPAMRYFIELPADVSHPARVVLSSSEPRMYFGLPSSAGKHGPTKVVTFDDASFDGGFYISIFPDRDTLDEEHSLTVRYLDGQGRMNVQILDVHVIDQDMDRPLEFNIILDFSNDRTGMLDDPEIREVIQEASDDFAYFIGDMNLDEVPAGEARVWIWNPGGYDSGRTVTNRFAYTGTLIAVYGHQHPGMTASAGPGYPSLSSNGVEYPIRGSGTLHFDPRGVWVPSGYVVSYPDSDWWIARGGVARADVYGTTIHEMGHSLLFDPRHPGFARFYDAEKIDDPAVVEYFGSAPRLDRDSHLPGTIDVTSRRGAFGNELGGETPYGREILTKSHMLIAQAAGYTLRDTSPFRPLTIIDEPLAEGRVDAPYAHTLHVSGGIPAYYWAIASGRLPRGLSLDSFTGAVSGTPSESGRFTFTVRVRDNTEGGRGVTHTVSLDVASSPPESR